MYLIEVTEGKYEMDLFHPMFFFIIISISIYDAEQDIAITKVSQKLKIFLLTLIYPMIPIQGILLPGHKFEKINAKCLFVW